MCWKSLSRQELRNVLGGLQHYLSLTYAVNRPVVTPGE